MARSPSSRSERLADALLVVLGVAVCALLLPALRSLKIAREGRAALAAGDVIAARVAAAASRNLVWFTFGFAGGWRCICWSSSSS